MTNVSTNPVRVQNSYFSPNSAKLKGKDGTEYDKALGKIIGSPKPVSIIPQGQATEAVINKVNQEGNNVIQGVSDLNNKTKVPGAENCTHDDGPPIGPAGFERAAVRTGEIFNGIKELKAPSAVAQISEASESLKNTFTGASKIGEGAAEAGNVAKTGKAEEAIKTIGPSDGSAPTLLSNPNIHPGETFWDGIKRSNIEQQNLEIATQDLGPDRLSRIHQLFPMEKFPAWYKGDPNTNYIMPKNAIDKEILAEHSKMLGFKDPNSIYMTEEQLGKYDADFIARHQDFFNKHV